jgi:hypothetical protein
MHNWFRCRGSRRRAAAAQILFYTAAHFARHDTTMKTWIAILFAIGLLAACIVLSWLTRFNLTWFMVLGTALWAAIDSPKLQLGRYKSGISYEPVNPLKGESESKRVSKSHPSESSILRSEQRPALIVGPASRLCHPI